MKRPHGRMSGLVLRCWLVLLTTLSIIGSGAPAALGLDPQPDAKGWTPPLTLPAQGNRPAVKLVQWNPETHAATYVPEVSVAPAEDGAPVFLGYQTGRTMISEQGQPWATIRKTPGYLGDGEDPYPPGWMESHGITVHQYTNLAPDGTAQWTGSGAYLTWRNSPVPAQYWQTIPCVNDPFGGCQNAWGESVPWTEMWGNVPPPEPDPGPEPEPQPDPGSKPAPVECPVKSEPILGPNASMWPKPELGIPPIELKPWFYINGRVFCNAAGDLIRLVDVPGAGKQLVADIKYLAIALDASDFDALGHSVTHESWPEVNGTVTHAAGISNPRGHVMFETGPSVPDYAGYWTMDLSCTPEGFVVCGQYKHTRDIAMIAPLQWIGGEHGYDWRFLVPVREAVEALGGRLTSLSPLAFDYHIDLTADDFKWANHFIPAEYGLREDYARGLFNKSEVLAVRNLGLFKHERYRENGETPNMWAPEAEIQFIHGYYVRMVARYNAWDLTTAQVEEITAWLNLILGYYANPGVPSSQTEWADWQPGVGYAGMVAKLGLPADIARRGWTPEQIQALGHKNRATGLKGEALARIALDHLVLLESPDGYHLSYTAKSRFTGEDLPSSQELMSGKGSDHNGPDGFVWLVNKEGYAVGQVFPNVKATLDPFVAPYRHWKGDVSPLDEQIERIKMQSDRVTRAKWEQVQAEQQRELESLEERLRWQVEMGEIAPDQMQSKIRQFHEHYQTEMPMAVSPGGGYSPAGQKKLNKMQRMWVGVKSRSGVVRTNLVKWLTGRIKFPFRPGKPPGGRRAFRLCVAACKILTGGEV